MAMDKRMQPDRERGGFRRRWSTVGGIALTVGLLLVAMTGPGAGAQERPAPTAADLGNGFQDGFVQVDGGVIHYVMGGSGPPVVLLHGWPQTWWMWRDVMPGLAQDHTVIAFDLPGLGSSTPPQGGYDKATTAARLHEAVAALGFERIDVIAHDIGALTAYPYAQQFPESVGRVVVINTPLTGFGLETFYDLSFHFLLNLSPAPIPEDLIDNDGDVERYLGMIFGSAPNPAAIAQQVYFDAYADPAVRSAGYEYYRAYSRDAAYNQANAEPMITTPVLALGGELSFGPLVAESFGNVAADVREVVVPGVGHFIAEEDPDFVVECTRLFLNPAAADAAPASPELAGCQA